MPTKLAGPFLKVFVSQGYGDDITRPFIKNLGKDENKTALEKDIPRTALVDGTGKKINDFNEQCLNDNVYKEHYRQGNLDGGGAIDRTYIIEGKMFQRTEDAVKLQEYVENNKSLRFAFRDDEGVLCGFGLAFNGNKPENWVLEISKHTTAPIDNRVLFSFSQGKYAVAGAPNVALTSLPEEIKAAAGSEFVNQLVAGLIKPNGEVSLVQHEWLNSILKPGMFSGESFDRINSALFEEKVAKFNVKLIALGDKVVNAPQNILNDVLRSGQEVLEQIKAIEKNKNPNDLPLLNKVLTCAIHAMENPTDNENLKKLVKLSKEANTQKTVYMEKLAGALLMFSGKAFDRRNSALFEEFEKKVAEFNAKLTAPRDKVVNAPQNILNDVLRSGQEVLEQIKAIEKNKNPNDLPLLNKVLTCAIHAMENPTDNENLKELVKLSKEANTQKTVYMEKLAGALLMFTGAVIIVAGIIAAIPTLGASLSLSVLGAFEVGCGQALWDTKTPLTGSTESFKESLAKVVKDKDLLANGEAPAEIKDDDAGHKTPSSSSPPSV